jgi:8-oxo-dGTP pyrophosphatase MutT (NUDIX family)
VKQWVLQRKPLRSCHPMFHYSNIPSFRVKGDMLNQKDLSEIIREVLNSRSPKRIPNEQSSYVHAAVLFPIFSANGEYKVLFTQRTHKVENHKGQISFPGGGVEEQDGSLQETALREAHEEIGLLNKDVEILGQLDDTMTVVSNFVVHPFVGRIPYPYDFKINRLEVKRIIEVPLRIFLSDDPKYRRDSAEFEGVTYPTPAYLYKGDLIWGATARIIEGFTGILSPFLPSPLKGEG